VTQSFDRSGSRAVLIGVASYTHPKIPAIPAATKNVTDLLPLLTADIGGAFSTK